MHSPTPTPSTLPTPELYDRLLEALDSGSLATARELADELCRPERAADCHDMVCAARQWPALADTHETDAFDGGEHRFEEVPRSIAEREARDWCAAQVRRRS